MDEFEKHEPEAMPQQPFRSEAEATGPRYNFENTNGANPIPDQMTEPPVNGVYSGVGVGRKETIFSDAAYTRETYGGATYTPQPAPKQPSYVPPVSGTEGPAPKKKEPKTRKKGRGKAIVAACLVGALVGGLGGGGLVYGLTNNIWQTKTSELESSYQAKLDEAVAAMQGQGTSGTVNAVNTTTVISPTTGLTPAQVYQNNVDSVVYIENQGVAVETYYGRQVETPFVGSGSGFVISSDGYIFTNYHVVDGYQTLTVTMHNGDTYDAKLVGYDSYNDVALLKVDATGLPAVVTGDSDHVNVGDPVVAIGNPLGELTSTLTGGYISAKDRQVNTDGTVINMLQTDAAINSGNSGGPLFNMNGEVIGITSAKYSGSTSSGATIEGIGFAIPINDVMSMLDDLKEFGYVTGQAYLGITVDTSVSTSAGATVVSVTEGSCAEAAGLQSGDVIIALGDYAVTDYSSLASALRNYKAGDTATLTVFRSGRRVDLTVTFDEKQNLDTAQEETVDPGEVPDEGSSYEEWYDYFERYFGGGR